MNYSLIRINELNKNILSIKSSHGDYMLYLLMSSSLKTCLNTRSRNSQVMCTSEPTYIITFSTINLKVKNLFEHSPVNTETPRMMCICIPQHRTNSSNILSTTERCMMAYTATMGHEESYLKCQLLKLFFSHLISPYHCYSTSTPHIPWTDTERVQHNRIIH